MSKDPAFLFYSESFLLGCLIMPFEDRGKYITLLCYQHQNGHLTEETIRLLVGNFSDILKSKFKIDENGLYFNERLDIEIEKRKVFVDSRRENGNLGGRPKKPLGKPIGKPNAKPNENLIINKDIIKNIIEYLNKKIGTTFKENSKKTVDCINARLNENFTYDDFVLVIDYKAKEWKSTEFEKFLRPETLFGNKFEGYLQASKIKTNNQNNISNDRKGKSSFEIIKSLGENFK